MVLCPTSQAYTFIFWVKCFKYVYFMNSHLNLTSLFSNQLLFQTHQIPRLLLFLESSSNPVVYLYLDNGSRYPCLWQLQCNFGKFLTTSSSFKKKESKHCSRLENSCSAFNTWVSHIHRVGKNPQPILIWGHWKLQCQAEKAVVGCNSHEKRKQNLIQLFSDASLNH